MSERGEFSASSSLVGEQGSRSDSNSFHLRVFHAAVKEGNVNLVETLLKTKAHGSSRIDVEFWGKDEQGSTALHLAAAKGREQILDMLLDLHPDVNIQDGKGKTALNVLSEVKGLSDQSAVHIVKRFLEEGADPRIPNHYQGRNCLHTAASVGNVQIIRCLLDHQIYGSHTEMHVNINAVTESGQTALHLAVGAAGSIFGGREDVLMELLRHNPNVNVVDSLGKTAFYMYLSQDNGSRELEVVRRFLQLGIDLRIICPDRRTYLHVALLHNKVDVVKCLLEGPDLPTQRPDNLLVDINGVDKNGLTALHLAVTRQGVRKDVLLELLRHNPDVNVVDNRGKTALHKYFSQENGSMELEVIQRLLELGADINVVDKDGLSVLHLAALKGNSSILAVILDHNPDVNIRDRQSDTALSIYLKKHEIQDTYILRKFLHHGTNPNEFDAQGFTPLHLAVSWHRQLAVRELLKHGADPNLRAKCGWANLELDTKIILGPGQIKFKTMDNGQGFTALHIAAANGYNDAIEALLEHGADVAARDNLGFTPLILYVNNASTTSHIFDKFQKCGADLNELDAKGFTPLHVAVSSGCQLEVRKLLEHGADPNIRAKFGWATLSIPQDIIRIIPGWKDTWHCFKGVHNSQGLTALHIAAAKGYNDAIVALLDHGADVAARDNLGSTALHLAVDYESPDNRVLENLLAAHPDVNIQDKEGNTALIRYCGSGGASLEVVKNFIRCGAKLQILNEDRQGCLHAAAAVSNWTYNGEQVQLVRGLIDILVSEGVEKVVDAADVHGSTLRLLAAACGYNAWGYNALLRADRTNNKEQAQFVRGLIDLLVSEGVEKVVDAADVHGSTPRLLAAACGNKAVLEEFLRREWYNPLIYFRSIKEMVIEGTRLFQRGSLTEKNFRYLRPKHFIGSLLLASKEGNEEPKDEWSINAPENSFSSKMALRSDAVALGFKGLSDPFDSERILVVVVTSPDNADSADISFLHPEGMALLLGVGIPFSKVVVSTKNIDGSIEVREIGETAWRALWLSSPVVGSLAVCNPKVGMEDPSRGAENSNAAGIDSVDLSSESQELSAFDYPQQFLFPFSLSSWGSILPARTGTGVSSSASGTTGPAKNDRTSDVGIGGGDRVTVTEKADQSKVKEVEKLELIVNVWLDRKVFTFDPDKYGADSELLKQTVEPVLKITFLKDGEGHKIFKTHLELTFGMEVTEETLDDFTMFGWFQNYLRMAFKCLATDGAIVESQNVYLNCEERHFNEVRGHNRSTDRTKGKEKKLIAAGGYSGVKVEASCSTNEQTAINMEDTQTLTSSSVRWFVKKTNFAVISQGGGTNEIACLASLSDSLDVLHPDDRNDIIGSGRISQVIIQAEGEWKITDNENAAEISNAESWCPYQFTGTRMLQKVVTIEKSTRRSSKLWKKEKIWEKDMLKVKQKIDKTFIIDHSFSCVEHLRRKKPYEWNLVCHPEAPERIRGIVDTVPAPTSPLPSSSPRSSSSSSNMNVPTSLPSTSSSTP